MQAREIIVQEQVSPIRRLSAHPFASYPMHGTLWVGIGITAAEAHESSL
jgi:hypothetical protein